MGRRSHTWSFPSKPKARQGGPAVGAVLKHPPGPGAPGGNSCCVLAGGSKDQQGTSEAEKVE